MKTDFYKAVNRLMPYGSKKKICEVLGISSKSFPERMRRAKVSLACAILDELGYEIMLVPKEGDFRTALVLRDGKTSEVTVTVDEGIVILDDGVIIDGDGVIIED